MLLFAKVGFVYALMCLSWSASLSAFAETVPACRRHGWCMHWHSQCTPTRICFLQSGKYP